MNVYWNLCCADRIPAVILQDTVSNTNNAVRLSYIITQLPSLPVDIILNRIEDGHTTREGPPAKNTAEYDVVNGSSVEGLEDRNRCKWGQRWAAGGSRMFINVHSSSFHRLNSYYRFYPKGTLTTEPSSMYRSSRCRCTKHDFPSIPMRKGEYASWLR